MLRGIVPLLILAPLVLGPGVALGEDEGPSLGRVYFPPGDCTSGWIELEVWNRETHAWEPRPGEHRVRTGSCLEIDTGILLNELRIRCIDPSGEREPSGWVMRGRLA